MSLSPTRINVRDLTSGDTVNLIFHHQYSLSLKFTRNGIVWELAHYPTSSKYETLTNFVGRVSNNDLVNKQLVVFGGGYSGKGLGMEFVPNAVDRQATAVVPWNSFSRGYLLKEFQTFRESILQTATGEILKQPLMSIQKIPVIR